MNNKEVEKKLKSLISGVDKSVFAGQNIDKLLRSPQGKKLAESLSEQDKEKLLKQFMSMDNREIQSKLKNAKVSDLSGLADALKKLR